MRERLRVDSSLVSIMLIVLISSALVVFSLAHEKIESPVELLKNVFPKKLFSEASVTTTERMDFSFSLSARRDMKLLEIQYATLVQVEPVFVTGARPEGSLEEIAQGILPVRALLDETENSYVPYEAIEVKASYRNFTFDGLFYDFPLVRLYSDPDTSGQVYTSFLILRNGTDIIYLEGISDFFLNKLGGFVGVEFPGGKELRSAISSLRIRRNENMTSYSSAVEVPDGWKDIAETPPFGRVTFADVLRNDTFSVDFTVETPKRPQKMSAHVIRVIADGKVCEVAVNLME